ncbi:MAG: hypothetical protein HYX92_11255 [Chloroflexi bacterium]|nr:hypothetical protein [Chloroflexota bacterium]
MNRFFPLFLAITVALAACAAPAAAPPAAPKTEAPAAKPPGLTTPAATPKPSAPKSGGTVTASIYAEPTHLDIHQASTFRELAIGQPLFNGLMDYDPIDPGWKMRPSLAEKWDVSQDGKVITLRLREGVKWGDGKPFTSADAKWNLDRIYDPPKGINSVRKSLFAAIEKVEAPEAQTVVIRLKYPFSPLLGFLASGFQLMLPKHVVEATPANRKIGRLEEAVGTGPFKLASLRSGVGWTMTKKADYFMKGLPRLDGINYYVIPDGASRMAALRTRRTLILQKSPTLTPSEAELLQRNHAEVVLSTGMGNSLWGVGLNINSKPLNDVRVRKALHLAIDRQRVLKAVYPFAGENEIGGIINPTHPFAPRTEELLKRPGFRQPKDADIAEAKKLLAEAGYPNGFELEFVVRQRSGDPDYAVVVADEFAKLGIKGKLQTFEATVWYDKLERHDFQVSVASYNPGPVDPHVTFGERWVTGSGRNYEGVADPRIDSLFEKQARALNTEERKQIIAEMERIATDEIISVLPLHWKKVTIAYWKEVERWGGYGVDVYEGHRMDETWLNK